MNMLFDYFYFDFFITPILFDNAYFFFERWFVLTSYKDISLYHIIFGFFTVAHKGNRLFNWFDQFYVVVSLVFMVLLDFSF